MSRTLFTLALIATLGVFAAAQDSRVSPPLTARENLHVSTQPETEQVMTRASHHLPFCPPKTCLYYAGDSSNGNGFFNANYDNGDLEGQVWVGVKPPKAVTVTGITFNQFLTSGFTGTNPTPFQAQIGITAGNAGKVVCNTSGNATMTKYGESDFGLVQYSYTIKKLKQPCKMQPGSKGATYVNLLPTSDNGYGYLASTDGKENHRGWKNDYGDCYFNAAAFGDNYVPLGNGCEFSIALTGKETK